MEKTLVIYVTGSYYKYHKLYVEHLFGIDEHQVLHVYRRDHATGEEFTIASFRTWDYFVIEESDDY